jgi:hypothetical protein
MSESEPVVTTHLNVEPAKPQVPTLFTRVSKHAYIVVGMIASFTAGYMVGRNRGLFKRVL